MSALPAPAPTGTPPTVELRSFPGRLPEDFRRFALEHGLWERTFIQSGFRRLWDGECTGLGPDHPWEGFLAAVARVGGQPVGLGLLERRTARLPAEIREPARTGGDRLVMAQPWCLRVVGRTAFYVTPEHRGQGLASTLLHALEETRRAELDPVLDQWSPEDVAVTIASGRAHDLASAQSNLFRCLPNEKDTQRRRAAISEIARHTPWIRLGDPAPLLRPLPEWTQWPGLGPGFMTLAASAPTAAGPVPR